MARASIIYPQGYSTQIYQPTQSELSSKASDSLDDCRRRASFDWLGDQLRISGSCSINRSCRTETERKRAQRILNNDHVSTGAFLNACCVAPDDRFAGRRILNVCDQTSIHFSAAVGRLEGTIEEMGVVDLGYQYGQNVVVGLALEAEKYVPYGLSSISFHSRAPTQLSRRRSAKLLGAKRDARPLRFREGHKWVAAVEQASKRFANARQIVHIIDQEADSLNFFCPLYYRSSPAQQVVGQTQLLVRVNSNRWMQPLTTQPSQAPSLRLSALLDQGRKAGQLVVERPTDRRLTTTHQPKQGAVDHRVVWKEKRIGRRAVVQITYARAKMDRHRCLAAKHDVLASVRHQMSDRTTWFDQPLSLIRVREVASHSLLDDTRLHIEKDHAIEWTLLTTLEVSNTEQAQQVVRLYAQRFRAIEQLFRVAKKGGFNIEAAQQKSLISLQKITAMTFQQSARVLRLVEARDQNEGFPIQDEFSPSEMEVLDLCNQKWKAKSGVHQNPFDPTQLSWATWIIARLGGWKPENKLRPPGPVTLQRGLVRFEDICQGVALAKEWQNDVSQP